MVRDATATTDVVVIGGGPGGLATALFAARRGFEVLLVERDGDPRDGSADGDFDEWRRPGVPQARQSHVFLGRGCRVLAQEAADVMDALLSRGVLQVPVGFRGLGVVKDSEAVNLLSRRLVFEGVLRRAVLREPRVGMIADDAVVGLTAGSGRPPVVTGVKTQHGRVISAALVVDATGRRSPAPTWIAEHGAAEPPTSVQQLGLQYLTRFYRLRTAAEYPSTVVPLRDDLGYMIALAFAADNATFSLTLACLVNDPLRRALADPRVFEEVLGAVPLTRPWLDVGDPISPVHPMARIENRWRRLVDSHGPLVGDFVLVGDSSMHTNPTFGRGVSLALAQAQHVADTLDAHDDALQYVADYEWWTDQHLGEWFATQVQGDQATFERFQATIQGAPLPAPSPGWPQFFTGMRALAPTDEDVAQALARVWNLLSTPTEIMADTNLVQRVERHWSSHAPIVQAEGPGRATFEEIVTAH